MPHSLVGQKWPFQIKAILSWPYCNHGVRLPLPEEHFIRPPLANAEVIVADSTYQIVSSTYQIRLTGEEASDLCSQTYILLHTLPEILKTGPTPRVVRPTP